MNIAIIGEGLQALVASALFASVGNQVSLIQQTPDSVESFKEPGLTSLIREQQNSGRLLHLSDWSESDLKNQNSHFDFILLSGISPDHVLSLYQPDLLHSTKNNTTIVMLSPAEIGEAEAFSVRLNATNAANNKKQISVCCVPLLVREGRALNDFSRPESIIIGCDDDGVLAKIKSLFYPFNRVKNVIKLVSTREAEFSCFAGNAMLATRLSFMNEIASLAEESGVDVEVIRECIGSDPRIGQDYLYPGCGYGGKALAENVARVADQLSHRTDDLGLLDAVARINERQKDVLFRKIWRFFKSDLKGKHIAIWGASFKPNSPSIIGSPAIKLIESLIAQSASVSIYDPMALDSVREHFSLRDNVTLRENIAQRENAALLENASTQTGINDIKGLQLANSADEALNQADVLAICTEWKEFWSPDFEQLKISLSHQAIFDGRNIMDPTIVEENGLKYYGIGRGKLI